MATSSLALKLFRETDVPRTAGLPIKTCVRNVDT